MRHFTLFAAPVETSDEQPRRCTVSGGHAVFCVHRLQLTEQSCHIFPNMHFASMVNVMFTPTGFLIYSFVFPIHFFGGSYAEISSGHGRTKLNINTLTKEPCYTNFPSSSLQANCKHTETCLLQHPKQLSLQMNQILYFLNLLNQ